MWLWRNFLNIAAQAADKYKYTRVFSSQVITSNTLFVFHWTLWSIYKLFIIQLLQVSKSISVSNKTEQLSCTKNTHERLVLFISTNSIFWYKLDSCLKLQLKTQSLETTQVSTFLNSIRSRGILRLTSYRLCSLPLLYIPYALNYSPITKNPQHLNLHTGSSSLPAVQDMPKSWHLRRSQPGREKKAWGSTFYILKF